MTESHLLPVALATIFVQLCVVAYFHVVERNR